MGLAIFGMLAAFAVHFFGGAMASSLFSGDDLMNLILGRVFVFIATLIAAVFSAGLSYLYLKMARGETAVLGDILYFFRHEPDRVITASLVLSILDLVATLPYYYYIFTVALPGDSYEAQMSYLLTVFGLLLLSSALNVVLTVPFAMSYYLLADDAGMKGLDSLKKSAAMMKGSMIRYLGLEASFIPVLLLSVITLYFALLWVVPHLYMSETIFYMKLLEAKRVENSKPAGGLV